ncbi:DUF4255 domain-containing protein [uncultured Gemmiger sp.]|uniref:DUF4255 domain-containing protein n=1 Tax=uncultured Gemmiger sp. TaxID=1623490 RepID=UPI0025D6A656|nr:DUF4255 domain-containing protein [uncultured Gemmiger sp.]
MADFSVVADVSAGLLRLLRAQMCPSPVSAPESIRLAAPTDKNGDFQLGLYLYDLRELGEYRAGALQRGADNIRRRPPRPLTLHYMLFLNSKAQMATGAEAEQRILGRALQVLSDYPAVDVNELHPYSPEPEEAAAISLLTLTFEEKTKIWAALSTPYQLGIYFSVSPLMLSSRREESFARVREVEIRGKRPL